MFRKFIFVLMALTLLLAACGPVATPTPTTLTFTDGLGREVKLTGPAQRVVSLAPSNTEILFAVGAGKQVVGCDDFSDYPPEAGSLPKIGSLEKQNTEQIVALNPDLVLAAEINSQEQVNALTDLGLTVYYLSNPKTIEDLYTNLEIVAQLTGHEPETVKLIEALKARVTAVDEKLKGATAKPVVFYELDSTDPAKPWTAGPGTFIDLLLNRAGGANLTTLAGVTEAYPQISVEQVVSTDPDLILLGDAMWGVTVESVGQRPGWEKLKAVTGNQVFPFDDNLVSRPGPRLVDGLEALAKLLHPELFK